MTRTPSVTLVSMPWTTLVEPSLGLGLLRAVLDDAGIAARVRHLNLEMLRWLTPLTYIGIGSVFALNDFLFSGALDEEVTPRQERLLREKAWELISRGVDERANGGVEGVMRKLLSLRAETIPRWLDEVADDITASDATLVGFSCMFDQTIASVALARRIRERAPDKLLALGGYAVRPPTGEAVLRAFPWIDAICTGEGEPVIVPLAAASAGRVPLASVPGILVRDGGAVRQTLPAPGVNMDDVPVPRYEDFFADVASLAARHAVDIGVERLPIENSRGCWWGAVHHCVFCGIHDDDMRYRTRSAGRVLETMDALAARHGIQAFRFADYILPHGYHQTLVPELIRRGAPYRITCEVKANFTAERFAQLAAAGFTDVQPGVESFSTAVLRRMDKGVTAAQNVHTLLLGRRHDVHIDYNLLYGLPGDGEEEYEEMLAQLPRLVHLDPPDTRLEVQITRYAPLQASPERFGLEATPHAEAYELVFTPGYLARSGFDLDAYCYYFERPFENPPRLERLFARINAVVDDWRRAYHRARPALWYRLHGEGMEITDSRTLPAQTYVLGAAEAAVLLAASEPVLSSRFDAEAIAALDRRGMLFRDGERILALVLPHPEALEAAA
ncbi:MAG TPA: RiPP maturation radical SAM C-methyltransferase [Thermoanaerobaculia bacterium]|nr:RiPP maturation radical SAM C-methyltransferase [Thermoanaerobaculia bacterium]